MRFFPTFLSLVLLSGCSLGSCATPKPAPPPDSQLEPGSGDLTIVYNNDQTLVRLNPKLLPKGTDYVKVYFGETFWGIFATADTWHLGPLKIYEKRALTVFEAESSKILYTTTIVRNN